MRLFLLLASALLALGCRPARVLWQVAEPRPETRRTLAAGEVVGGEGRYGSHAWLGIPFAAPPVGQWRWRAPQPLSPWPGQREALKFAPSCAQLATEMGSSDGVEPGSPTGSEDCLYLNVWAPKVSLDALASGGVRLPVMVWVHGGGNSIGTASFYDGGNLAAAQNVVVVSVQYRLGPFGWLRHAALREGASEDEQSGNFGTLDLIASLAWVQQNIAAFGGDPGNVTVFGESAGGANVFTLLMSPRAKGLFHRAIVQSGGLSRVTPTEAEALADAGGHRSSSGEALLRALVHKGRARDRAAALSVKLSPVEAEQLWRGLSKEEVLALYNPHLGPGGMLDMPLVFLDGQVLPEGDWLELLARPDGWNRMPVLVGTNRDEVKLFFALDPKRVRRVLGVIPRYLDEPRYHAEAEAMSRLWKANGADGPAEAMVRGGWSDVFVYRFDWADQPSRAGVELSKLVGAAHALEIPFVFGHFDLGRLATVLFTDENKAQREKLSGLMQAYWAEFARSGKPGKGAGGAGPEWASWTFAPEADKQMVFDVPVEQKVRMTKDQESVEGIVAAVDADPRLPTQRDKCRAFYALAAWSRGLSREKYPTLGKQGCAAFPWDRFPWEEK